MTTNIGDIFSCFQLLAVGVSVWNLKERIRNDAIVQLSKELITIDAQVELLLFMRN